MDEKQVNLRNRIKEIHDELQFEVHAGSLDIGHVSIDQILTWIEWQKEWQGLPIKDYDLGSIITMFEDFIKNPLDI